MSTIHSRTLPDFITAGSAMLLRQLMFKTNARDGKSYQYFDIQQFTGRDGKLSWIAWFYRDIEGVGSLNESTEQL